MAKNRQRGRPKTIKGNRVRVSIMLDPDLVDWSRNKRSDMVNRLMRAHKDEVSLPYPKTYTITYDQIIKLTQRTNDGNENDPVL